MNIIQIQDRLKGLPTEALVNYVEQPMGEVPIYLALGELQRRKEMKERFFIEGKSDGSFTLWDSDSDGWGTRRILFNSRSRCFNFTSMRFNV